VIKPDMLSEILARQKPKLCSRAVRNFTIERPLVAGFVLIASFGVFEAFVEIEARRA
jgi:hypothetical protein